MFFKGPFYIPKKLLNKDLMSIPFLLVSGPIKNRMWKKKKNAEELTVQEGFREDRSGQ